MAKAQLTQAFRKAELGEWLCKPVEQDMFDVSSQEIHPPPPLSSTGGTPGLPQGGGGGEGGGVGE